MRRLLFSPWWNSWQNVWGGNKLDGIVGLWGTSRRRQIKLLMDMSAHIHLERKETPVVVTMMKFMTKCLTVSSDTILTKSLTLKLIGSLALSKKMCNWNRKGEVHQRQLSKTNPVPLHQLNVADILIAVEFLATRKTTVAVVVSSRKPVNFLKVIL